MIYILNKFLAHYLSKLMKEEYRGLRGRNRNWPESFKVSPSFGNFLSFINTFGWRGTVECDLPVGNQSYTSQCGVQ